MPAWATALAMPRTGVCGSMDKSTVSARIGNGRNTQFAETAKNAIENAMNNQIIRLSTTLHPLYVALHGLGSPKNYIDRATEP
jgi:hypothetical protein